VVLNLIDPVGSAIRARAGTHDLAIVSALGGASLVPLSLTAPHTAVANYSLIYPVAKNVTLRTVIDFSPDGISLNAGAVGDAINRIQAAQQSPAFGPLAANLFYQPDVATLGIIHDSLGGGAVAGSQQTAILAADWFLTALDTQTAFWLGNQVSGPNGLTAAGDRALESTGRARYMSSTKSSRAGIGTPGAWRLWTTGYDGRSDLPGDATRLGGHPSEGGIVGFDYQVSP
jgi:hypothetical protein